MTEHFDHTPDAELGAALRSALASYAERDQAAFVARVMARYDEALEHATSPTWDVLASWLRPGIAAAAAALLAGFLIGRAIMAPSTSPSFDTALAPAGRPGLAALVTATEPPDASVLYASVIEPR
jgi:2-keto-3-deoxy-galactonokinase